MREVEGVITTQEASVTALSDEQQAQLRERMDELAERAQEQLRTAVRSVYRATKDGAPDQIGSCILLDLQGLKILLTAAHIIDENKATSLYVTGVTDLVLVEAEFICSIKPRGARSNDLLDFAAARIPVSMIAQLGEGYVRMDQIRRDSSEDKGHLFTILGHPNSANEFVDHERSTVATTLLPYSSTARFSRRLGTKAGNEGRDHLFIDYGKFSREDGAKMESVEPPGLSGGAVIDAGEPSDLKVFRGEVIPTPRLAGMVIEWWKKDRVLVASRLETILPTLLAHFLPSRAAETLSTPP